MGAVIIRNNFTNKSSGVKIISVGAVQFKPGNNEIHQELHLVELRKNPAFAMYCKTKMKNTNQTVLEIVEGTINEDVVPIKKKKTTVKKKTSKEETVPEIASEPIPEITPGRKISLIHSKPVGDAVGIIKQTLDIALLKEWLADEDREDVRTAITEQIDLVE